MRFTRTLLLTVTVALPCAPAFGQQNAVPTSARAVDAKAFKLDEPGLYANADLSYVLTSGNSSSSSLGFKGDLTRRWTRRSVAFAAGAIRAASTHSNARYGVGTPNDFELLLPDAEPTAESYFARGRYDNKVSDGFFVSGGAGWERNRYSGIDARWLLDAGVGYAFVVNDRTDFRGVAGVTLTDERYTSGPPERDSFLGLRAGWDLRHQLTSSTTLVHTLIVNENLETTEDLRADASVALQVAINSSLALKANWRLLYDNDPALAEVPLFAPGGVPAGATVLAPYKKTDQGVSVSLVLGLAPKKP